MGNNQNNSYQNSQDAKKQIVLLSIMEGLIATLGESLATIAIFLSQQGLGKRSNDIDNISDYDLKKIQKKINTLTKEIKQIQTILMEESNNKKESVEDS